MTRAAWLVPVLAGCVCVAAVPSAHASEPPPDDPSNPPSEPEPPPPEPEPEPPREPDPPPPEPVPDPPSEPDPPAPDPPAEPTRPPNGGEVGGVTGQPSTEPDVSPTPPKRWGAAPFGDLKTSTAATNVTVGGDLVLKLRCKGDSNACNGGRLGFRARFPVTQGSATGTGRASADALQGFSKAWRVGLVTDYIRETTGMEGPAKFFMLSAAGEWGVQSFLYFPDADPNADSDQLETRHSVDFMLRALVYRHHPRKHRIAPQIIARYRRDWVGATPVGIVQEASEGLPDITRDLTIDGPEAGPVFAVTVPVIYSVQKGGAVLPQLGFGPTVSYAARGRSRGYNPFNEELLVRLEHWVYWYPTGSEGLEGPKTNVRIGAAPFLDIRLRGRDASDTTTNVGALIEVKVGVRGYEY